MYGCHQSWLSLCMAVTRSGRRRLLSPQMWLVRKKKDVVGAKEKFDFQVRSLNFCDATYTPKSANNSFKKIAMRGNSHYKIGPNCFGP